MAIWIGEGITPYTVGQVGFLLEEQNVAVNGDEVFSLCDHPGHTDFSHAARLSGWLGTTDDIYRAAHGLGRVTRIARNGRALVVALTSDEQVAALEELGYPDLE
jgi:hypothetical protein